MKTHATATIEPRTWEEQPYAEIDGGPGLAHAIGSDCYHGDIEAEASSHYVVVHQSYGDRFVGLQRVVGRVGEHSGSFVLDVKGTSEDGVTTATWSVVPGSGTGELCRLGGEGGFTYEQGLTSVTLDYDLE